MARRVAGGRRRVLVGVAAVGLVVGALVAPAAAASSRTPPSGFAACPTSIGATYFCGTYQVPMQWSQPNGADLSLWVTIVPARGVAAADPLFFIDGGPGADADGDIPWLVSTFRQLNETHDLVIVEQRGTGYSGVQTCTGIEQGSSASALALGVRLCISEDGTVASHFTTAAAAHDLDFVRSSLGYKTIDLYGVSYGVSLGLAYLQRYGATVRTAVFDSGSLLTTRLWQEAPLHAQWAFDRVVRRCAATPACAKAYDPATDLSDVLAQVEKEGGSAAGALSEIDDVYLGESTRAAYLPEDLHLAATRGLSALAKERSGWSTSSSVTQLMPLTVTCGDAWAAIDVKDLSPTTFAPMMVAKAAYMRTLCSLWPHDPGVGGAVRSSAPILFLNGTADPTDPPANVAGARSTMPNAALVPVPGSAHWVLNASWNWGSRVPACLLEGVTRFVNAGRPTTRAAWAACTSTLERDVPALRVP